MSWQAYVDDHLMPLPSGAELTHGAILGIDGGVWAQSPNFPELSAQEVTNIVNGFTNPASLGATGILLGGEKYMSVAGDEGVLRGKKGPGGVTIKKTKTAMVIGIYSEGVQPGDCNVQVENLADYLIEQGI